MCLSLLLQTPVGSVDSSDAVLRVSLAASYDGIYGGLCGNVGPSSTPLDLGLPVGAAHFTKITARGKTHLTHLSPPKDTLHV